MISQGDLYWAEVRAPVPDGDRILRPYVVIQNNLFNRSTVNSVLVCALTSNIGRARAPGNVLLKQGEGNLPKHSVVNVTQVCTILRRDLRKKIGSLSSARMQEILSGVDLVLKPREVGPG